MTAINKFNLSKIYVIKSPHTDLYYIGSTTQPLYKRFNAHKIDYKKYLTETYHFVTSYKILEHDDAYIELLEEINCENRKQLEKREGELIREHRALCVNKTIAGRTQKEWTQDNIDKIKEQKKQYRIDNLDKIKQHDKQYYIDNADKIKQDSKQYRIDNSDKIKQDAKQYYIDNADKIKQDNKQYRIDNLDKMKQHDKQYYIDNSDKKKQYQIDNTDKIKQYNKQYRIDNSEMLKEKRRIKYAETKLLKDLALITI